MSMKKPLGQATQRPEPSGPPACRTHGEPEHPWHRSWAHPARAIPRLEPGSEQDPADHGRRPRPR